MLSIPLAVVVAGAGMQLLAQPASAAVDDFAQHLAIPAYINPTTDSATWDRLLGTSTTAAGKIGIVVVNDLNGPGSAADPAWQQRITQAHAAGQKVLGYVDTGYFGTTGQLTRLGSLNAMDWMSQVQQDVTSWYRFYTGMDGIFFDQMQNRCGPSDTATDTAWVELYRYANRWAKQQAQEVYTVANPGYAVPQC
jgi:Spherulation-specific family 4